MAFLTASLGVNDQGEGSLVAFCTVIGNLFSAMVLGFHRESSPCPFILYILLYFLLGCTQAAPLQLTLNVRATESEEWIGLTVHILPSILRYGPQEMCLWKMDVFDYMGISCKYKDKPMIS